MNKALNISQILVYYDLPELFLAKDIIETKYISLLVDIIEDEPLYIATPVSNYRIAAFINGGIDLRTIFVEPEIVEFYTVRGVDIDNLLAEKIDYSELPEEFLPSPDFYYQKDEVENETIKSEVVEKENAIVHLALSDSHDNMSIEADDLGDFIKLYQTLVYYIYKKELAERHIKQKRALAAAENYKLRAFASSQSSFNIHLYSTSNKDLFGNCAIEYALSKIDKITGQFESEEQLVEALRTIKGHAIGSFKKILYKIIKENITLKYKWFAPNQESVNFRKINKETAERFYSILQQREDLIEESREFIGYFKQADVSRGNWRISNEEDQKQYSGSSSGNLLEGVTLETVKYKLICLELMEEEKVTEKENVKFVLKEVQPFEF